METDDHAKAVIDRLHAVYHGSPDYMIMRLLIDLIAEVKELRKSVEEF